MSIKLLCIDPLEDYELIEEQLLSSYGIETVFVCKSPPKNKNYVFVQSLSEDEIYRICHSLQPDYIVCSSEGLFALLAKIRAELNIQGMNLSKAMLLSHKHLMYEQLHDLFPYPKTKKITESLDFPSLSRLLESKELFIKPIHGTGSYETYHVKNSADYELFLSNQKTGLDNYIAQAYINADLYHSELVVFKGEVLFVSARKYSLPNHLMVSSNMPIFSLNINDQEKYQTIIEASIRIKELLHINNGILHTEFFLDDHKNLHFIETNARAPGIGLNRMYRKKLSMSLETLLCFIVCGVRPPDWIENSDHYLCGYYPLKFGLVEKVEIPRLEVANEWITYVKPNDFIEKTQRMSKSAMVLCWDKCPQKIEASAHILSKHNLVTVSSEM